MVIRTMIAVTTMTLVTVNLISALERT